MSFLRFCQQLLAIADYLLFLYAYKFLRCVKWKILYWRMRFEKRRCKFLRKCLVHVFWKQMSVTKLTGMYYKRAGYSYMEDAKIFWEAPLAFTFWDKEGPLFGMAVEFWNDTLCIRQLQGVGGRSVPSELREWPRLFVSACILAAKQGGFKKVRLYRADQSVFYGFPDVHNVPIEEQENVINAIRNRMRRRYDGTARQMGLSMKRRWGEWVRGAKLKAET